MTGAAGMLGRDVVHSARAAGHEVEALGRGALDVTDPDAVAREVSRVAPAAVVNCAAYTDVDGAESHPDAAMSVNADGAGAVAGAAAEVGATVVYPSSDYVFDGSKGEPYVESDEPRPESEYARSKLAGEERTTHANERHFVVRSGWLFGTGGRNFVETMLQLARERGEVLVVDDQVGSPTYSAHLAGSIVGLLYGAARGVHHVAAAGECSWHEFALEIFRQVGVECRVSPATTRELARPAPRPSYSVLRSERDDAPELPSWRSGLAAYLAERTVMA